MPLPILPTPAQDLLRLFLQTEARWTEHLAEPADLDFGTAYANPAFPAIFDANNMRDVALPPGLSPQGAFDQAAAHFAARKTRCYSWTINPSAPADRTRPMLDHLLSLGYHPVPADVLILPATNSIDVPEIPDLKVIPARASFRHAYELHQESARRWNTPQLAGAAMLHLDDPHFDALLALLDGQPVAHAGVLAVGEIGRIDQVYVAESHRRRGLGRLMLARALEICARAQFRHVMLSISSTNSPALALYRRIGFVPVGSIPAYFAPDILAV